MVRRIFGDIPVMNETEEIFVKLLAILNRLDSLGYCKAALHINNALEEIVPNDPRIPQIIQ